MRNWKYLKYLILHKYYVLICGVNLGVPLWRLVVHDLSKIRLSEWRPYLDRFYPRLNENEYVSEPERPVAFSRAWLRHQHRNPHHWQYWVLLSDHGVQKALEMPGKYALEMVADWMGTGRAITGRWECRAWYEENKQYMVLHPQTRALVERIIGQM